MNGGDVVIEMFISYVWATIPEPASTNVVMVLKYNSHTDIGVM